ncbi:MAG: RNA polymerase sigma factor [Clostridiales bacterium]|nr:RNA polymerase sigma factor [Clostridiales bacterium]
MKTVSRSEEEALVAAAAAGDQSAFEVIVRSHADAVYAHALRFFGDQHTAEDVVQEVFLKMYRSLANFDGRSALSTWLYRVTRNACLDMLRAGRHRAVPVDPVGLSLISTEDTAATAITHVALERAIRAIPQEDRDALGAVTLFGLSYREAADVLGIPEGTVKSRVFRARRALAVTLGPNGGVS